MRILVLQNDPKVPVGRLDDAAADAGHELVIIDLLAGEALLPFADFDGVVALGGGMGAYEEGKFPFLVAEKQFLAEAVAAGVPTLGLCLGSQLLADALGGSAYLADRPEVELARVTNRAEGDPLADAISADNVLLFHEDTFDVPQGATLLASNDRFVHGFRYASAVAIQPHPEVTTEIAFEWIDDTSDKNLVQLAGASADGLKAEILASEAAMDAVAQTFFAQWFAEAQERRYDD